MTSNKKTWDEFRASGLLWWVNRQLHLFGWAITLEVDKKGKVIEVYPARCIYAGFNRDSEEKGFNKVSNYLEGNIIGIVKNFKFNQKD